MQNKPVSYDEYIEQGSIGRHETFTPRYGWLKKGYDSVKKDGAVFEALDAVERLGVGKNMVRSIKFWCTAFHVIEPSPEGSGLMVTTEFGDKLLGDGGWDPYLEDIASIWLLHWQLFKPRIEAVNWSFAFNKCNVWSFNIKQLAGILRNAAQKYTRFASISENSFERDASCFIRMYSEEKSTTKSEIDSPFTQLGLVGKAEEKNEVSFNNAEKTTLSPLIFAATAFSYMCSYIPEKQRTISLQKLTYDFNSPGIVFKLTESAVGSYLHSAVNGFEKAGLRDNLGVYHLHLSECPEDLYWLFLEKYYGGN